MTQMIHNISDLIAQYREGAEGTGNSDPKIANRWHDRMHACYKQLRETDEGQAAIMSLMSDTNPHVKSWAAAHSLQWDMKQARGTLEAVRDSKGPGSFSAKITLQELDKGRLNMAFDY